MLSTRIVTLLLLFCVGLSLAAIPFPSAQLGYDKFRITSTRNLNAAVHLPDDYNTTTSNYPIVIFFHGLGERSNYDNDTDPVGQLRRMLNEAGVCSEIYHRNHSMNFVVGGVLEKFIVVCPQAFYGNGWLSAASTDFVLNSILARYRIDLDRVYLTGISAGGWTATNYIANSVNYARRIAAVVPVAGVALDLRYLPGLCAVANFSIGYWSLCGTRDAQISGQARQVPAINHQGQYACPATGPHEPAKATEIAGGEHNTATFSIAYRTDHTYNPNIYEWMLQHRRGTIATPTPAPIA